MDDFWKNSIVPVMQKHRDFEHSDFFTHELDNGGGYDVDPNPVMVDHNPIDFNLFDPPRRFYFVDFTMHSGNTYAYLVPAEDDGSEPEKETIRVSIDTQIRNPVEGSRDWYDYLDLGEPDTLDNPRVIERYSDGDIQNRARRNRRLLYEDNNEPKNKTISRNRVKDLIG